MVEGSGLEEGNERLEGYRMEGHRMEEGQSPLVT